MEAIESMNIAKSVSELPWCRSKRRGYCSPVSDAREGATILREAPALP